MRPVLQVLILGVGMDGGHQTTDDAELVIEHLGQRPQAVGGTRRVADDFLATVVFVVIHPSTIVISGPVAGAEITTFLAPPPNDPAPYLPH